jgi:hypothetical protein
MCSNLKAEAQSLRFEVANWEYGDRVRGCFEGREDVGNTEGKGVGFEAWSMRNGKWEMG